MIELYEFALSGNCHKVRLMLSLLGLPYAGIPVNGTDRQHKTGEFLAMNPFGQVPVLKDGEAVIRDSQAILVYLARQYGGTTWWSEDAATLANIAAWLSTAANEVARGPNALRLHHKFGRNINVEEARQCTDLILQILETQLDKQDWIVAGRPSIADVALYPYIALAHEGQVSLEPYPSILDWLRRMQMLPGYVGMPGMWHP